MRILISNDDGYEAEGIRALASVLSAEHEVIVVAPEYQQSGMSHAITVAKPMELKNRKNISGYENTLEAWSICGTPADCVKIYLESMAEGRMPDLVISGINHGANLGTDVLYSGTVGAAIEGFQHDITAIAISRDYDSKLPMGKVAEIFVNSFMQQLLDMDEKPSLYNVNFPRVLRENPELVFTRQGKRDYTNAFRRIEEDGRVYFMMQGEIYDHHNDESTDIEAIKNGFVTVTPLQLDLTDYRKV